MDDLYAINLAKTRFREAFNSGDPERLIALLDPEFVYMQDGLPTAIGFGAAAGTIRTQFAELATLHSVQLTQVIIEIRIQDGIACDYGWQLWTKKPRDGEPAITTRERYVDAWRKNGEGEWKLGMFMTNADIPPQDGRRE